jgi:hypothetical protein
MMVDDAQDLPEDVGSLVFKTLLATGNGEGLAVMYNCIFHAIAIVMFHFKVVYGLGVNPLFFNRFDL